jgi:signal transduction histidine kinase/ligand-binding sensor domain-containing protein
VITRSGRELAAAAIGRGMWWLLLFVVSWPGSAVAQNIGARKVFGHYRQWSWTEQHGLPMTAVNEVVRTRTGHVWLATDMGLVRFDGVQFTVLTDFGDLRITSANAFLEDRSGTLWIATDSAGVVAWRDGRYTQYGSKQGLRSGHTTALFEDRRGQLWVGTMRGGLARLVDGRFASYTTRDGLPSDDVLAVTEDSEGTVWIGTSFGLARFDDGTFVSYTTREGLPASAVRALAPGASGDLWIGTDAGVVRLANGRFIDYSSKRGLAHEQVLSILRDREGALWVGSFGGGVCRLATERYICHRARDGLPGDRVGSIFQHADGDIWLGTEGGLVQLKDPPLEVLGVEDGFVHDYVGAVRSDRLGSLWVASVLGLNRYQDKKVTVYTTRDGLPSLGTRSIAEDRDGQLWLGGVEGLARFDNGRFTVFRAPPGSPATRVYSILSDRAGRLWLGGHGVISEFRDANFESRPLPGPQAPSDVLQIYEDRHGVLWLGTRGGGVLRYDGETFTRWTTSDGLSHDTVGSFYEDPAGGLWMGTAAGVSRLKDGRLSRLAESQGLTNGAVTALIEDASGRVWMSTSAGLYRVSVQQMIEVADGVRVSVTAAVYGLEDGLLARDFSGASPGGWKTADGDLWFPSRRGLVHVRPARIRDDSSRTLLEQVTVDGHRVATTGTVTLRSTQKNLQIRYSALNWNRPHAVSFRYRIVGLDADWISAGNRRAAYYPYLPPGHYTFEVMADNGHGEWPAQAVQVQIAALPAFYQTRAFALATGAAIVGAIALAWGRRERRLQRQQALQRAFAQRLIGSQEAERQRIAAELHDSLGQRLVVINNLALLSLEPSAAPDIAREQVRQISRQAQEALDEVTEISYNLRPYQLDRIGLTKAIEGVIRAASLASHVTISSVVADVDGLLSKDAEINFYRILQEGLNNVVKHANATDASVTVSRVGDRVALTVQDNGRGCDPEGQRAGDGKGGFGLIGLRERARLLGGSLSIDSAPGRGTRVHLEIPLAS